MNTPPVVIESDVFVDYANDNGREERKSCCREQEPVRKTRLKHQISHYKIAVLAAHRYADLFEHVHITSWNKRSSSEVRYWGNNVIKQ